MNNIFLHRYTLFPRTDTRIRSISVVIKTDKKESDSMEAMREAEEFMEKYEGVDISHELLIGYERG